MGCSVVRFPVSKPDYASLVVGTRYISISAYQASRDDELSFVRGAVVKVLKKYVDGWWLVRSVWEAKGRMSGVQAPYMSSTQ